MQVEKIKIRFEQRFANFAKSLKKLHNVADTYDLININEKDRDSLIKRFELTFELAWNCYKDYLEYNGEIELYSSRNTIKTAFKQGLIINGVIWLEMIETRVLSVHSYDEENANKIAKEIIEKYLIEYDIALDNFTKYLNNIKETII
ncbi:MAG: HI0074 family nucleotidyltransferase substrate-binding subunit [Candidatus Kapaibacteriota bacterium]|jgi:nucleotidyltransferase substrate binding protein (TIGR01987 family)